MTRRPTLAPCYVRAALALFALACLTPNMAPAQEQERPPIKLEQLERLLTSGVFTEQRIIDLATQACLAFRLDVTSMQRLEAAGASASLLRQLRNICTRIELEVNAVVVTPQLVEVAAGDTASLLGQAWADSVVVDTVPLQWASSDTAVASVDERGLIIAVAEGSAQIFARTEEGVAGFSTVTVTQIVRPGGKSVGAAAALGVIVPGGGEFYTGEPVKGAVVLLGAAGAIAAGYLITQTDTSAANPLVTDTAICAPSSGSCTFPTRVTVTETEKRAVIAGAAVAGAFWIYGLIDGIRNAKRSQQPLEDDVMEDQPSGQQALRVELAPYDGIVFRSRGDVDITLVRIKT